MEFNLLQTNVLRVGLFLLAILSTNGFETWPLFHYTAYSGLVFDSCSLQPNPILKYAPYSSTLVKSDYLDVAACWAMTSWPKRRSAGARFILISVTSRARASTRSRTRCSLPIPMDQLSLAVPIMDLATKAALLMIGMIEFASAVVTFLWPQEGLGLLLLSTLFVYICQMVPWLRSSSWSPSCMVCLTSRLSLDLGRRADPHPPVLGRWLTLVLLWIQCTLTSQIKLPRPGIIISRPYTPPVSVTHISIWNCAGQRITVIFACDPNVAVNAII